MGGRYANPIFSVSHGPFIVLLGLALGVLAYKKKIIRQILAPLRLNQPHFSYLIPVAFGIGHHAGISDCYF